MTGRDAAVEYANVLLKEKVEAWGDLRGFNASERLAVLLESAFGTTEFTIDDASVDDGVLYLEVTSGLWKRPKRIGMLDRERLVWAGARSRPRVRRIRGGVIRDDSGSR